MPKWLQKKDKDITSAHRVIIYICEVKKDYL